MSLARIEELFLWLMIYSVVGWIYESTLCSITGKKLVNRGFLNGPYCPIYGCGAVLDILVLGRLQNPGLLFVLGVLLTCSLEYFTSFIMEELFHARWWDYSDKKFNINGRVCLLGAVVFGAFSVVLILVIHPFVKGLTDMLPQIVRHIVCAVLFVGFTADCIITVKGISGFDKKLNELSEELAAHRRKAALRSEEKRAELAEKLRKTTVYQSVTAAFEAYEKRINAQEKRMLKAFPKFRIPRYNDTLEELRSRLKKQREMRKKSGK